MGILNASVSAQTVVILNNDLLAVTTFEGAWGCCSGSLWEPSSTDSIEWTGGIGWAHGFTSLGFVEGPISVQTTGDGRPKLGGVRFIQPAIAGDFNRDGFGNTLDIFDFLTAWFAFDARADFNGSGEIDIQDVFDFLRAWFVG